MITFDLLNSFEWKEEDHPRHPAGTEAGGEFAPKDGLSRGVSAALKAAAIENVEKIKNRLLANNEPEPAPEEPEEETPIDDDYNPQPESWDQVSSDQQEAVKDKWISDNEDSYLESELENYWEESYLYDAKARIFADQKEWGKDNLRELLEERGVDLEKSGLLDSKGELIDEALGEHWTKASGDNAFSENSQEKIWQGDSEISGYLLKHTTLNEPEKLINPQILDQLVDENGDRLLPNAPEPNQLGLEGIPQPVPLIETAFAQELIHDLHRDVIAKIGDANDWMEAPDASYFSDGIKEVMDDSFESMDDSTKFDLAKDQFGEEWDEAAGETSSKSSPAPIVKDELAEPTEYKLISDGRDYNLTKNLGNELAEARFREVLKERGIDSTKMAPRSYINDLWSNWKESSTKPMSVVLQAAAAEELGGNYFPSAQWSLEEAKKHADEHIAGGFEGMKAYVRAQWETNQYLMEKAGVDHIDVYRAVFVDSSKIAADQYQRIETESGIYDALPKLFLHQNGAASFTVDESIANNWAGVGKLPPNPKRIVIRARVPAESILSLPVFGKNVHGEKEVVVSGIPWKSWDAWAVKAPSNLAFELLHPRGPDGRFIEKAEWKKAA